MSPLGWGTAFALLLVATLGLSSSAAASDACTKGLAPEAHAVFVDEKPVLDGILDDPVWAKAEVIDQFNQVEPKLCEPSAFRTEMRILTDGEALYVSLRAYDPEPDKIVANRMARTEIFFFDDGFNVILDTFLDRQNGYFFQVNPNGGRRDGTFAGSAFEENWDGIWNAEARIDAEGWTAEVEIPFKTLGFRPGADTWGLNLSRRIRRVNQEDRWADPSLQRNSVNMSRAGTLTGMSVAKQGVGLDVVPTFSIGGTIDQQGDESVVGNRDSDAHGEVRIEPSFDAFYRVLPSLTASVTVNTDFAQTEIDEAQLNLSRFSLFFPEKREFFLRDAGIFRFADLTGENGIPFFSRRIGLDRGGNGVRLLGGGRVSGRVGRFNVGFIDIQQDANENRDSENLAVARVSANVLEESNAGFLLTHGDPNSREENLLIGGDFNFRSSQLIANRFVSGSVWLQQNLSGDNYEKRASSFGGTIAYPNDKINWSLKYREIEEGFDPALGFVNRQDIRRYDGTARYRFRNPTERIRTFDLNLNGTVTTERSNSNKIESARLIATPLKITSQVDDSIELQYVYIYEDQPNPFYVARHIGIAPGTYTYHSAIVILATSQHRPIRTSLTAGIGEFYDGWGFRVNPLIEWRPNKYLLFSAQYDERWFQGLETCKGGQAANCVSNAPAGVLANRQFQIRLARLRMQVAFSPDVSWSTLVQWDNISDEIEFQTRFRWIIEPGREFFVVVGQDFEARPGDFRVRRTEPTAKLRWTFRF